MASIKGKFGTFTQDMAGIWHYHNVIGGTANTTAARDALAHRPKGACCFFWFNGVFVPIHERDTAKSLVARHRIWEDNQRKNPDGLSQWMAKYADIHS